MLYDYLTALFNEQWRAIREGFFNYGNEHSERAGCNGEVMDSRGKQLSKILLMLPALKDSIEEIAGSNTVKF